jgi:hypothetical protein
VFITGCLLAHAAADPLVKPLNHSVLLLKEADIILSNDAWTIAVDIDLEIYHDTVAAIRSDLFAKRELNPTTELRHVETLLQRLEKKLTDFHKILRRKDRKRGLVNLAGNVMKMLIGMEMIADVNRLHETLEELRHQNLELAHSVDHQVTYIQKLKTAETVYLDNIANLSSTVKEHMVQAHLEFQNFAHELMLFNISFLTQSSLVMSIRQLEFSMLRLIQQLDDLMHTTQTAMLGKVPISPPVLLSLLKNVTLQLLMGYNSWQALGANTYFRTMKF